MKFRMSKIAAAIAAATMASSAGAAVVLGGNDGWEVSMDGNVNLFYNHYNFDTSETTATGAAVAHPDNGTNGDSSHLQEGLLPAFFSTNIKSPTVNGLTGTARISFAPDSSSDKHTFNDKGGTAIDMREVVANVAGSFGTVSFGRTLGLFGRQAILHDQTLFGVGDPLAVDGGGTTLGRIGVGYVYPEFRTRFAYATPNINGFKAEVGVFDPQELTGTTNFETSIPKFEGELSYATTFSNAGNFLIWAGGTWQTAKNTTNGEDVDSYGGEVGAEIGYMGFALTGYYYGGKALGIGLKNLGTPGPGGIILPNGVNCGVFVGTTNECREADNDGFYVQGAYNFGQGTKVALSYGESNQDGETANAGTTLVFNDVNADMWTVGVYHDLTPWLKLVAEYNNVTKKADNPVTGNLASVKQDIDAFSVGAFMTW
ncbi:MAG: porin [Gammaproteobacteria bacterium]